jgi:hypothetical protein
VDPEVDDPPGQPEQQANGRKGRAEGRSARVVRSLRKGPGLLDNAGTDAGSQKSDARKSDAQKAGARKADRQATGIEPADPQPSGIEPADPQPSGIEPAARQPSARQRYRPAGNRALASTLNSRPLMSRPLINPHLRSDPRLRIWITRLVVALVILVGFAIVLSWRVGLTVGVIYIAADSILRSKTTSAVPAGVRVTSAQRFTRRRLKVLQPSGYVALHARAIPGTRDVVDHVVVGPAGVFTLDSQRLDRRLPIRAIGGMLYHGRTSMEERFDHAKHEANHAATLITAELGQRVRVRPVMVLYGPSISWVIMKVKGVDVFDGSRIGTYFRRQSKAVGEYRLNHAKIAMVLAATARALPPLE